MPAEDPATAAAIRRHEERLTRDPRSLAFAQLADLYRKAGRVEEAVGLCRDGLARYPEYTTARLILAKSLMTQNAFSEALDELGAILKLAPRDVQCHRLAAEAHRKVGNLDAAVQHLEQAVALDPGDRESRALLPLLRAAPAGEGEAAAAREAPGLMRVLRDDTFVTLAFGTLCLEQGAIEEAAQVFTRILRREPHHQEARERLEQALRARARRKG
jgi:tetratricopeptide (TPR) repeat protein